MLTYYKEVTKDTEVKDKDFNKFIIEHEDEVKDDIKDMATKSVKSVPVTEEEKCEEACKEECLDKAVNINLKERPIKESKKLQESPVFDRSRDLGSFAYAGEKYSVEGKVSHTKDYTWEEVKIEKLPSYEVVGYGRYKWLNRPWYRFEFEPAVRQAFEVAFGKENHDKIILHANYARDAKEYVKLIAEELGGKFFNYTEERRIHEDLSQEKFLERDIEVYDIDKFLKEETKDEEIKLKPFIMDKAAIIVTPSGKGVIVDYEAIGKKFDSVEDEIKLETVERKEDEKGKMSISLVPTHLVTCTIKEIIEKAPKEVMKAKDFFTKYNYNPRCAHNFDDMLKELDENGLKEAFMGDRIIVHAKDIEYDISAEDVLNNYGDIQEEDIEKYREEIINTLPKELDLVIEHDNDLDLSDEVVDEITRKTGFLVSDCKFDADTEELEELKKQFPLDEAAFNELVNKYLNEIYDNIEEYKTTNVTKDEDKLITEGVIKFKSGKETKTSFIFESAGVTKRGKVKYFGSNKTFSESKKAFMLQGTEEKGKFICENLTFNYNSKNKNLNESKKVYGRVIVA